MLDINVPDVMAEVTAAFARYERALVDNDIGTLDQLFWDSPWTLRYGVTENLYGYASIAAFRSVRSSAGLARTLSHTVITTFGRDFATASTLFHRDSLAGKVGRDFATASTEFQRISSTRRGRQTHTWVRAAEGWRIVAAHVSLLEEAAKP